MSMHWVGVTCWLGQLIVVGATAAAQIDPCVEAKNGVTIAQRQLQGALDAESDPICDGPRRLSCVQRANAAKLAVTKAQQVRQALCSGVLPRPATPQFEDIGPDIADGVNGGETRSGVIGALGGTRDLLYAVAKTAGVWRSRAGGPWVQLSASPRRAFALAVDPSDPTRLFVGEREDDAADPRVRGSGLWTSGDAGTTWQLLDDGLDDGKTPGASRAIPAIAVVGHPGAPSTVIFATVRGVGRFTWAAGHASPVKFGQRISADTACHVSAPQALGEMTTVTASAHRIWARSDSELVFSGDDGLTYNCRPLPQPVFLPGFGVVNAVYNSDLLSGIAGGSDDRSLAAFDDRAYLVFTPVLSSGTANSPILTFVIAGGQGNWVADTTHDGDGLGLGGQRFVRAREVACPLPGGAALGAGRQLVYGSAQGLQQALSEGPDQRVRWDTALWTSAGGPDPTKPLPNPRPVGKHVAIHSDLWDILLPLDYCPATPADARSEVFVASDGGVHQGAAPHHSPRLAALRWTTRNVGLHTHTAQHLFVAQSWPYNPLGPQLGPAFAHIGYPTQDNDGWWRRHDGKWMLGSHTGDNNFVVGDVAGAAALFWRQFSPGYAYFTDDGGKSAQTLNDSTQTHDGPTSVQAVQSLAGDPPAKRRLDLVMLVTLPLKDSKGHLVKGPLGTAAPSGDALIRTTNYAAHPSPPNAHFAGWTLVTSGLPRGVQRFWVSGGHRAPRYYVYTDASNRTCPNGLLRDDEQVASAAGSKWPCLIQGLTPDKSATLSGSLYGSAFVSPYDPNMIVVSRATPAESAGVYASNDGGATFCLLPVLTALVTGSGQYPFGGVFTPDFASLGSRFHGDPFGVPEQVAFDGHDLRKMIVTSPFTGLFVTSFRFGDSGPHGPRACTDPAWREPQWLDLTPFLPQPLTYISDARGVADAVVVATRGRGVYALEGMSNAHTASYFTVAPTGDRTVALATVRGADGAVRSKGWVRVGLRRLDGAPIPESRRVRGPYSGVITVMVPRVDARLQSDPGGAVPVPLALPAGAYRVELSYEGDSTTAPSSTRFVRTVP